MQTDLSSQAQAVALEYLFLFHACKLTNHRPDQSVSQSEVARCAGLAQEQAEQVCTALRDARLIRFSSLLGDISATRFGVSEIITSKACPHTGANYFPAIRQMGLRFSRGHHLFDEPQLTWVVRQQDGEQESERTVSIPSKNPTGLNSPGQRRAESGLEQSSPEVRKQMIEELEKLLEELDTKTPSPTEVEEKHQQSRFSTPALDTQTTEHRTGTPASRSKQALQGPSLLFNPEQYQALGFDSRKNALLQTEHTAAGTPALALASTPATGRDVSPQNNTTDEVDVSGEIERLFAALQVWCQQPASNYVRQVRSRGAIDELERINESLFHFA